MAEIAADLAAAVDLGSSTTPAPVTTPTAPPPGLDLAQLRAAIVDALAGGFNVTLWTPEMAAAGLVERSAWAAAQDLPTLIAGLRGWPWSLAQ